MSKPLDQKMLKTSVQPATGNEFQTNAKSKINFNHSQNAGDKYIHDQSCDILLNTFQIKKKRYKVLLNYDHIVWEEMNVKRCSNTNANNEKTPATLGASADTATASVGTTNTAAAQKEAEYEREKLSQKADCENFSNVLNIREVIRISKGKTKAASVRNAHKSLLDERDEVQELHQVVTPTEQYLSIYYAERNNCSPTDCNRWQVRRLTLHNNDPYIVVKWYDNLQNLLKRNGCHRVKHLLVFINPYGGRKMALQTYERTCKPIIQLAGIDASCIITQRANQIRDILMSHDLSPFDAVCCVGGDGTVAEMINGLIMRAMHDNGLDMRRPSYIPKPALPIAIIPAGSTDTIAYSLHGTSDVQTAAIHLVLGQRRGLDICSVRNQNGIVRFCTSVMGYGYLGDVAAKSEKYRWMGTKRYEFTGVKSFLLNRGYEAEVHMLLNEDELESGSAPSGECLPNALEVICNVNCERCKNTGNTTLDPPTASSNESLALGFNNSNFEMGEERDFESDKKEHSKSINYENCDKDYSENILHNSDNLRPTGSQRSVSTSSSGNIKNKEPHVLTNEPSTVNEARKWRVIRGEYFLITAVNITCACTRSPNGLSRYCHLGDGHMDVVLVRKTSLFNNIRLILNTMGQNGDIRNLPFVEVYRTKQFLFKTKSNNWIQDYNSVSGSSQPIANAMGQTETNGIHSSWNCDGEVVTDLEITMNSHRQLVDVLMRGPYIYSKPSKANKKSIFCCCCCCSN